jgi:outer membrane protein assembly factor BamB
LQALNLLNAIISKGHFVKVIKEYRLEARSPRKRVHSLPSVRYLLPLLLLLTVVLGACVGGRFEAKGWSGIALSGDDLVIGAPNGSLLSIRENGVRRWKFPQGESEEVAPIYAKPAISDGKAYVGEYNGFLYAVDLESGNLRWKVDTGDAVVGGAVVGDGKVVVGSSNGKLLAYDADQGGTPLWEFPASGEVGRIWSSPVIHQGVVYFGALNHKMYAVSLETGLAVWNQPFEAGGAITTTPLIANGKVYIGSFDKFFYALDASSGQVVSQFEGDGWFWGGAITDGNLIYVGNLDGYLYAWDGRSIEAQRRFYAEGAIVAPPIFVGTDWIAVASDNERVHVLDRETFVEEWTFVVGSQVRSAMASNGNLLYISSIDNVLAALDVGERRQLWSEPLRD